MNEKQYIGKVGAGTKIKRALWNTVRVVLFRPFVTKLFRPWRIALLKLFGAKVDWNAEVYASARIWAPWNLEMEAGSCLGPDTICYNQARVVLKQDACLSQYAYICTAGHDISQGPSTADSSQDRPLNNAQTGLVLAPVTLHQGAWVGTRAYINMGVEVGANAVVGACACVIKDVESSSVVGGNPAVKLR